MDPRNILAWSLLCAIVIPFCGCGGDQQPSTPAPTDTTTGDPVAEPFDASDKPEDPPFVPEDETETTESESTEPETTEAETEETSTEPETEDPFDGGMTTEPAKDEPSSEDPFETSTPTEPEKKDIPAEPAKDEPAPVAEPYTSEEDGSKSSATPDAADRVVTGDWPCWGGNNGRNMVNATTGIDIDFSPIVEQRKHPVTGKMVERKRSRSIEEDIKNLLWTAELGSQTYGNPVVADGKVLVGTNNGAEYRPEHEGDRGCLLCFDEKTGKFLWQLTREKLEDGRGFDWPDVGICSTPFVEGDRVWLVTNRCELMCLDLQGFYDDGENDGPYTDEVDTEKQDADIVWILDMFSDLGVRPHNQATSSPAVHEDMVCVLTSNGVDEDTHEEIPAPKAPSFLGVNKNTGEVVWQDNTASDKVLHGQWSSPAIGIVNGQAQVYMAAGDGWVYALDVKTGEHIWKFDLNPKDSEWKEAGRGDRNSVIATPVFYENSVVVGVGEDPEYGDDLGHIYRIDVTKKGDISPETPDRKTNPNSGQIWHLGGMDEDGSQTGEQGAEAFRRTMSTVAIHEGLVYAPDLSGRIHCIDFETGKRYWEADIMATVWGSPMVADGKMFVGDEDGIVSAFAVGKELKKLGEVESTSSIYGTPAIANGVIFLNDSRQLYAIATQLKQTGE